MSINGKTPEGYLKDKASNMIWGWTIGVVVVGALVLTFIGVGIYAFVIAKNTTGGATGKAAGGAWDGKSTFECSGNETVALTGITASAGVKATGNCQLTMTGVNISAPIAIDASANAKVTMTGGSITASTNSVVASANAKVQLVGTKVSGKATSSGKATIAGAP